MSLVEVERDGAIAVVLLNRPEQLNALSDELMEELVATLIELDRDKAVRAIVLGGSERAFAAGADIGELAQASAIDLYYQRRIERWDAIRGLWTPLIAAVSGYCLGGGCELAMACDLIVASESAQFGQPETGLGIIPGAGGTQRLTRAVGKALAMDMILSGRRLSAQEALAAGLVARVVPDEAWLEEAKGLAREIAEKGPVATRLAKESVDRAFETTLTAGLEAERRALYLAFASEDAKEGLTAFTEKRKPEFKGALVVQLGGDELQLEVASFAQDPHRHLRADPLHHHQALDVVHARHRRAVELDDQVFGSQPGRRGRAAFDDLDDLDAGLPSHAAREAGRQGSRAAGDPEVGAAEAAVGHQRGHDLPGRRVHGHRETEANACDGGVDADHVTGSIGERAAGVAGVQRRVGLDHVVHHASALGRQRAPERRDDAGRDGAREAVRVADRDHELPDPQALRVAQFGGHEVARVGAEHGQVRMRVRADDLEAELAAVNERSPAAVLAAGHDMSRGEHEAVGRDHDCAAAAVQPPPVASAV